MLLKGAVGHGLGSWASLGVMAIGGIALGATIGMFSWSKPLHIASAKASAPVQGPETAGIYLSPFATVLATGEHVDAEISMEFDNPVIEADMQRILPQARKQIMEQLMARDAYTIRSVQGTLELREDIKRSVNALLPHRGIKQVYLNQLLIR